MFFVFFVFFRTHDKKVKYFDMQTICDVRPPPWSDEDVAPFSEFLKVYADFVLQRTTEFGPRFAEVMVRRRKRFRRRGRGGIGGGAGETVRDGT